MQDDFLSRYLAAFDPVPWFSPDACLMFMAYHQLVAEDGLAGDTLEIGVHHGLSAIAVAALRGEGRRFVAIDLFDKIHLENAPPPGFGSRTHLLENMRRFYDDLSFVTMIAGPTVTLQPDDLGREYTFCHIDGGHSVQEAYVDLELATEVLLPGGLVAIDDYFNPAFPGVGEAAVRFSLRHDGALRPIAIGFNKVLLQREPAPSDLNARFAARFPQVFSGSATLWGVRVPVFDAAFRTFFDWSRSTARRLVGVDDGTMAAPSRARNARVTGGWR
jgi:hypothetical protein